MFDTKIICRARAIPRKFAAGWVNLSTHHRLYGCACLARCGGLCTKSPATPVSEAEAVATGSPRSYEKRFMVKLGCFHNHATRSLPLPVLIPLREPFIRDFMCKAAAETCSCLNTQTLTVFSIALSNNLIYSCPPTESVLPKNADNLEPKPMRR